MYVGASLGDFLKGTIEGLNYPSQSHANGKGSPVLGEHVGIRDLERDTPAAWVVPMRGAGRNREERGTKTETWWKSFQPQGHLLRKEAWGSSFREYTRSKCDSHHKPGYGLPMDARGVSKEGTEDTAPIPKILTEKASKDSITAGGALPRQWRRRWQGPLSGLEQTAESGQQSVAGQSQLTPHLLVYPLLCPAHCNPCVYKRLPR